MSSFDVTKHEEKPQERHAVSHDTKPKWVEQKMNP